MFSSVATRRAAGERFSAVAEVLAGARHLRCIDPFLGRNAASRRRQAVVRRRGRRCRRLGFLRRFGLGRGGRLWRFLRGDRLRGLRDRAFFEDADHVLAVVAGFYTRGLGARL